jgi:hypothetical protein
LAGAHGDVGALPQEQLSDGSSKALRPAGDDGLPVAEP